MRPQTIFVSVMALAMSIGAPNTVAAADNPLLQGMEKVEGSNVTLAYQRPGTRWETYNTVQILPLDVRIPVRDPAAVQQMYFEEMRAALAQKGLATVDTPRAGTLIIQAQLYQLVEGSLSIKMGMSDGSTRTMVGAMSDFESAKGLISNRDDVEAEARAAFRTWGRLIAADLKEMAADANENPIECFKWTKDCQ